VIEGDRNLGAGRINKVINTTCFKFAAEAYRLENFQMPYYFSVFA
jgi:hypothetical protein